MLERATLIRNNLIMAVLFADVRAARLQDQLMKPSGLQSPEEVLQAIGILPAEPSTSSTSMANDLADAVRFRCLKMLTSALKVASLPEDCAACKPEEMAAQLEAAIYAGFNKTNKKYKKRIQSRVAQLKDVRNQEVLCKYMSGAISAKQLAKMTPKEMASHMMTSNEKNSNPEAD
ncbi:transcription elongation factor S-II-like [Drosophila subobscura]|uniref:transcription elongation factor S-II-like n=1 Tax=Drosophila subobscura TaxID=7241 RepID=UPI00155A21F2|nr:transcription elongation factor S-II-like [Drosophila subobscura]